MKKIRTGGDGGLIFRLLRKRQELSARDKELRTTSSVLLSSGFGGAILYLHPTDILLYVKQSIIHCSGIQQNSAGRVVCKATTRAALVRRRGKPPWVTRPGCHFM